MFPILSFVRKWLLEHIPADSKTCVIHNDWRFDNVILDPTTTDSGDWCTGLGNGDTRAIR